MDEEEPMTATKKSGSGHALIGVGAVVLIGVTVALVIGLRGRPAPPAQPPDAGATPAEAKPQQRAERFVGKQPAVSDAATPRGPGDGGDAASRAIRAPAPPAIPSRVREEKDPRKRAQLMRMHRLATARVRASVLRRRRDLLTATIARTRQAGEKERARELELELAGVRRGLRQAQDRLADAKRAVDEAK